MKITKIEAMARMGVKTPEGETLDLLVLLGAECKVPDDVVSEAAAKDLIDNARAILAAYRRDLAEANNNREARQLADALRQNIRSCQTQLGRLIDVHPELAERIGFAAEPPVESVPADESTEESA